MKKDSSVKTILHRAITKLLSFIFPNKYVRNLNSLLVYVDRYQEHSINVNVQALRQRTFEQAEGSHAQRGVKGLSSVTEAPLNRKELLALEGKPSPGL